MSVLIDIGFEISVDNDSIWFTSCESTDFGKSNDMRCRVCVWTLNNFPSKCDNTHNSFVCLNGGIYIEFEIYMDFLQGSFEVGWMTQDVKHFWFFLVLIEQSSWFIFTVLRCLWMTVSVDSI